MDNLVYDILLLSWPKEAFEKQKKKSIGNLLAPKKNKFIPKNQMILIL